ncbi:hypothetical protein QVD17_00946 [Tagetes erecta]|uniref:Ethylene insensitive 3-like DNA-binding domain-containing protein n=1 Tax=Tagetes erecta TaxID=13708 RepID=A0AAD8L435_TARER|nr:hypothetical protein QVD17_00946 [Tagetes erecta]
MDDLMIDMNGLDYGSDMEGDDIRCDNIADKDVSDEEIEAEDLEKRMWKDRIKLRRIKQKQKMLALQAAEKQKTKQTSDQARRKKMSRAQDGILKYMLKVMEDCNARGFVYGIIPEKGKPVSGSSDNLRAWWKEKVKFDKNGPAAIAKYDADRTGDNGGSGITETQSGGCLDKNQTLNSYDSDYDVEGLEDGRASVSSKNHAAPPLANDKNPTQPVTKRKRDTVEPPQQDIASYEPHDTVPNMNQMGILSTDCPIQESIPDDHTLTVDRPLLVETGTNVQIPANDMLSYPLVQEPEYRPSEIHHGQQSSELHHLAPYPFYTPTIEEQQPINVFQNDPNAIPGDGNGMQNLEKDGFHNGHERSVDNHFESSLNSLSLDFGGFSSPSINFQDVLELFIV